LQVIPKIGIRGLIKCIARSEKLIEQKPSMSLLQAFIDEIARQNYISKARALEILNSNE